ncbi:MAG: alpha/beta hydrolase [Candidatus Pacebacteria bacterium]|nr:alpha/beta hydrolase [Candidatus Paceibacterota bacterium]
MRFQKKSIIINEKKVFYWEKNTLKKKAIIFLHGFPGSHSGLVDMANAFTDYRLIIPDLPACGESEPFEEKHNLENYSQWLNNFLNQLGIQKIILVGHSFGARIGLYFSSYYPTKTERLVFITPVVKVEGMIVRIASLNYKIAEYLPKSLQKKWLANPVYRTAGHIIVFKTSSRKRRKYLIAKDVKEFNRLDPRATIELFEEFYSSDLVDLGSRIKTDSLIIAGERDEIAPLNSVKNLADKLSNIEMIVMKGEGHIVVAESPLSTATIIRKWLEK